MEQWIGLLYEEIDRLKGELREYKAIEKVVQEVSLLSDYKDAGITARWLKILSEYVDYKILEKEGKLLKLPCKVGDTIFVILSEENYRLNYFANHRERNPVYKQNVYSVEMWNNDRYVVKTCEGYGYHLSDNFKETWFLTQEEAERKLEEMEEKNGKINKAK